MAKEFYTSGEVAELFGVCPRTACRWVDAGEFPGSFRVPLSDDRRVPAADLAAFAARHNLPHQRRLGAVRCVLLVGVPAAEVAALSPSLPRAGLSHLSTNCPFVAGARWREAAPLVVAADLSLGRGACASLAAEILLAPAPVRPVPALVAGDDFTDNEWAASCGYAAVVRLPAPPGELASVLARLAKSVESTDLRKRRRGGPGKFSKKSSAA